jgi:hypothetical protein
MKIQLVIIQLLTMGLLLMPHHHLDLCLVKLLLPILQCAKPRPPGEVMQGLLGMVLVRVDHHPVVIASVLEVSHIQPKRRISLIFFHLLLA